MSDTDLQDLFEPRFSSKLKPVRIIGKTDVLANPEDPEIIGRNRRDILEARHQLREYILSHHDKPYAFWEVFQAVYRERLMRDEWTGKLYKDLQWGQPPEPIKVTTADHLMFELEAALEVSSKLGKDDYYRKLVVLLEYHKFNPVKCYLEQVTKDHKEPMTEWDNLAFTLFGTEDSLHQEMLSKWLIGAVARAKEPGCQMRQCLVLKGQQETGKTQFLRALFGEYYASRDSEMKDADVYRQLRACWGMELEEMEAIASKRSVENLKRFISVQDDEWVAKYQEESKKHPRHTVFAGTVNSDEFLRDETGNSRFWVIDLGCTPVNVDYVRLNRDRIWAEAHRRWLVGERYWDAELSKKAQERAKEYQVASEFLDPLDPIMAVLERHFRDELAVKVTDLLVYAFNVPVERHKVNKADSKLAQALVSLGYERKQLSGSKTWIYRKPDTKPTKVITGQVIAAAKHEAELWGSGGRLLTRASQKVN